MNDVVYVYLCTGKLCSLQTCQLSKNRLTELPDTLDG